VRSQHTDSDGWRQPGGPVPARTCRSPPSRRLPQALAPGRGRSRGWL